MDRKGIVKGGLERRGRSPYEGKCYARAEKAEATPSPPPEPKPSSEDSGPTAIEIRKLPRFCRALQGELRDLQAHLKIRYHEGRDLLTVWIDGEERELLPARFPCLYQMLGVKSNRFVEMKDVGSLLGGFMT